MTPIRKASTLLISLLCLMFPCIAKGSVGLLMEEPFGAFGYFNPTGHAAIYLSNVCAASPVKLRRCEAAEPGVVISRYHRVDGFDWLAIPLIPYLYAVDSLKDIPVSITPEEEERLRDNYRRAHLEQLAPDTEDGQTPDGEWIQLVGASYDRRIFVYEVDASEDRDEAFIAAFNDRRNVSHFNLFFNNCADLSRNILDFYYPHSIHRNMIADTGLTTPKQVARSLTKYAHKHERLDMRIYILPQVQGSIPRSRPIDGVIESFLKKTYVVPLAIVQPEVAGGLAMAYLVKGRYDPTRNAETLEAGVGVERLYQKGSLLMEGDALGSSVSVPGFSSSMTMDGLMFSDETQGTK